MKQIIFTIILNIPFLIFSQTQSNQCNIDLNNLDLGMNVNTFFIDKIVSKDQNLYSTEFGATINAIKAFKKYNQTHNVIKSNLTEEDLDKEFYFEGDDKIKIAQLYSITRYTENDKLQCYQNIWFPVFSILATNDDKFVALIAHNRKVEEEDFKLLIENLKKTNKLNTISSNKFETFCFEFDTYYIKFKTAKLNYRSESQIQISDESKEKVKKIIDLELIILSKLASDKHLNLLDTKYGK